MSRKILIVDDEELNRLLLRNILKTEYEVVEAENGVQALSLLAIEYSSISAVVLDIFMPIMDGYEVLRRMKSDDTLSAIPVIIATATSDEKIEVAALSLGANDFIVKPYNAQLIMHCLHNNIIHRETSMLVKALQRDKLTGLYNRETFFTNATELIKNHESGHYIMSCFDIDNFKVINDRYGTDEGDRILKTVGRIVADDMDSVGGICGRISADNFAALYPKEQIGKGLSFIERARQSGLAAGAARAPVAFSVGRYIVADKTLSISAVYDRAYIAKRSVKGRYDEHVAYFDETMRERLISEQEIVSEMSQALVDEQFEVWFQPQFNHSSGALIGAEALVRWRHPTKGLVPPNEFIPVFEQNGFVYELDKYVWDRTCRYLRKWIDDGKKPLPVSVNISRYDIFRDDLTDYVVGLTKKYDIPADMLRLEITESAFARSSAQIIEVVRELTSRGFTMEIDDFGSGYSSLNILKDVPANVLKLDMRFLENNKNTLRGGNILESIVRMAKWLGMSVIAEGVEKIEQADFLTSIGCNYIQGFLYARPMPAEEYEKISVQSQKEERLLSMKTLETLDNNSFWDPSSMDTLIFNSYVGGACIFEYNNGKIELLRANEKYVKVIGSTQMNIYDSVKLDWENHLNDDYRSCVSNAINKSIETGEEVTAELLFCDLPGCPRETYLRSTIRVIAVSGERKLIYCTNENITAQRAAERKEKRATAQLQAIMGNINGGVTATIIKDKKPHILFANEKYFELLGYTRKQFENEVKNPHMLVYHCDRERIVSETAEASEKKQPFSTVYRAIKRDGSMVWMRSNITITELPELDEPVQIAVANDISKEKLLERDLLDNLPCGVALYEFDGNSIKALHINKRYGEMVGRDFDTESIGDIVVTEHIHPEDIQPIMSELKQSIAENRELESKVRILCADENYRTFYINARTVQKKNGKYAVYSSFTPASEGGVNLKDMFPEVFAAVMSSDTEISFIKDSDYNYICCSRAFTKALGYNSADEIIGKTDYDLVSAELADEFRKGDEDIIKNGKPVVDSCDALPKQNNKNQRFSGTSKYPLFDTHGNILGIYGVGRDITEDKENIERLTVLADNIPGGLVTFEVAKNDVRIIYYNEGFYRFTGYTREEYGKFIEEYPLFMVFEDDIPYAERVFDEIRRGKTVIPECVFRCHTKDGGYRWLSMRGSVSERRGDVTIVNAVQFDITMRKEADERLRISEEQFRIAASLGDRTVARYNIKTDTFYNDNDLLFKLGFGKVIHNIPQTFIESGMVDSQSVADIERFFRRINEGERYVSATLSMIGNNNEYRWFKMESTSIFDEYGQPGEAIIVFHDVTDELEKEAVYRKWQQSLEEKTLDSYTLFRCNLSKSASFDSVEGGLLQITFGSELATFNQRTEEYASRFVYPDDYDKYVALMDSDSLLAAYYRGKHNVSLEYREMISNKKTRWLLLSIEMIEYPDSSDILAYLMYENIDERKQKEISDKELAETDSLTGVSNRVVLENKTNELIDSNTSFALLMIDIDGFKLVNDSFGHGTGDKTLIQVAKRLAELVGEDEVIGRLGGDEFLVCLRGEDSRSEIAAKALHICESLRKSFTVEVKISASIGIAVYPDDGNEFDTLYHKSDIALYHVKATGKDNYAFYNDSMINEKPDEQTVVEMTSGLSELKRRMLIVDDNRINRDMLEHMFEKDYIIDTAEDGNSALIRLQRYGEGISVVLLDLVMPDMDGFAVLEKMRTSPEMQSIPVIVVSGMDERETALRTIKCGASDFITKPVDADLLRLRVDSAISKSENERLRAHNSLLTAQSDEMARYRAVLETERTFIMEYDYENDSYRCEGNVTLYLAGCFDRRPLLDIFAKDKIADAENIKKLKSLIETCTKGADNNNSVTLVLKTPNGTDREFTVKAIKRANKNKKIILAFTDISFFG